MPVPWDGPETSLECIPLSLSLRALEMECMDEWIMIDAEKSDGGVK